MSKLEKQVSYKATNTYETLNTYHSNTKNVWLVFHGLGFLSRYFLSHFKALDATENYIICPQAPSKFYLGDQYKHVGACWLTKENTALETQNVLAYIDAVFIAEKINPEANLIVLGYSQGVSIATRWLASRKIPCKKLILHSGGIPEELTSEDFSYLSPNTEVTYLYGDNDEYIDEARKTEERLKGTALFGEKGSTIVFKGIHEVHFPSLLRISK
jgi:predicted esterase